MVDMDIAVAPAPAAAPQKSSRLMVDLSTAIRATAETAQAQTLEQVAPDSAAGRGGDPRLLHRWRHAAQAQSDEDLAGIREWSKAEIARISEETDARITARKATLEDELAGHAAAVERRVDEVSAEVARFEAAWPPTASASTREDDPARLATMAEELPETPSFAAWADMGTLDITAPASRPSPSPRRRRARDREAVEDRRGRDDGRPRRPPRPSRRGHRRARARRRGLVRPAPRRRPSRDRRPAEATRTPGATRPNGWTEPEPRRPTAPGHGRATTSRAGPPARPPRASRPATRRGRRSRRPRRDHGRARGSRRGRRGRRVRRRVRGPGGGCRGRRGDRRRAPRGPPGRRAGLRPRGRAPR